MTFEVKMEELTTEMKTYTLALLRKRHYIDREELTKELFGEYECSSANTITSTFIIHLEAEGKVLSFYVWNDSADHKAKKKANRVYVSLPQYARELRDDIRSKNGEVELRGTEV